MAGPPRFNDWIELEGPIQENHVGINGHES